MYAQKQLPDDLTVRIRIRRLFGYGADRVMMRTVTASLTLDSDVVSNDLRTKPSWKGQWDQWMVFEKITLSELVDGMRLAVTVESLETTLGSIELSRNGYLLQGVYRIPLYSTVLITDTVDEFEDRVVKRVEDGSWTAINWLDELTFAEIAKQQLQEALTKKQLYLIVEFPCYDAPIKMSSIYENACLFSESIQSVDSQLRSCRSIPQFAVPDNPVPSSRSLPVLKRLNREPSFAKIPPIAPNTLWKYKKWLTGTGQLVMFLRTIDTLDDEEVNETRGVLNNWRSDDRFEWITAVMALILCSNDLHAMDEDIAQSIKHTLSVEQRKDVLHDESLIYSICQFLLHSEANNAAPRSTALLRQLLITETRYNQYAAHSVYWLLDSSWLSEETVEAGDAQLALINTIQDIVDTVRTERNLTRPQRTTLLNDLLSSAEDRWRTLQELHRRPVQLPTDPSITIAAVIGNRASVYKSSAMPARIAFLGAEDCAEHAVIVKTGEDLRGDLMVMRLIRVVDSVVWKGAGYDFRMATYSILPVGNGGWIEFVRSVSLSSIIADHGSISSYLGMLQNQMHGNGSIAHISSSTDIRTEYSASLPHGDVLENYIASCAGYSIVTFVLGVGDRHLENLLLTEDGRLFHVDFAFLFGKDPKPFPPPMKLCREMIEAITAVTSPTADKRREASREYTRFKTLILVGYQLLRENAALILNFLSLHRNVTSDNLQFVRQRLALDEDDVVALKRMSRLVEESINAMFPQVVERIHQWAQYWRD